MMEIIEIISYCTSDYVLLWAGATTEQMELGLVTIGLKCRLVIVPSE